MREKCFDEMDIKIISLYNVTQFENVADAHVAKWKLKNIILNKPKYFQLIFSNTCRFSSTFLECYRSNFFQTSTGFDSIQQRDKREKDEKELVHKKQRQSQ